jgi:hypothetical protein
VPCAVAGDEGEVYSGGKTCDGDGGARVAPGLVRRQDMCARGAFSAHVTHSQRVHCSAEEKLRGRLCSGVGVGLTPGSGCRGDKGHFLR